VRTSRHVTIAARGFLEGEVRWTTLCGRGL
jgi:hypothetical protein